MAFNSGNIATISIGGNDISQYTTSVSLDVTRDIKDIKPIGGSAVSKVVGPYAGTVSLEGGYDPALDNIMAPLMLATTPATQAFVYKPGGAAGTTLSGTGYIASYRVDAPGDDTAKWKSELAVVGTITHA